MKENHPSLRSREINELEAAYRAPAYGEKRKTVPAYGDRKGFDAPKSYRNSLSEGLHTNVAPSKNEAGFSKTTAFLAIGATAVALLVGGSYAKKGAAAVINKLPKPAPMYSAEEVEDMQKVPVRIAEGSGPNAWIIESGQGEMLDGEHPAQLHFLQDQLDDKTYYPGEEVEIPVLPGNERDVAEHLKKQG